MEHTVTKAAKRPASNRDECFYCGVPIGGVHGSECVLVNKDVKVKVTIEYDIQVPAHWDKEKIEWHRNKGTWCSINAITELNELAKVDTCFCSRTTYEYVQDVSSPYLEE